MALQMTKDLVESQLTEKNIGAAIEVHRHLGPGLLESTYQACLARELELASIPFEREKPVPVEYKGLNVDCGYRLDFVVDGKVIVELKSVDAISAVHSAQLMTYMRLSGLKVGLLINFNVPVLKNGIKRIFL